MRRVAQSFRVLCERVGSTDLDLQPKTWTYGSEVLTLAYNTRKGGALSVDALQARINRWWAHAAGVPSPKNAQDFGCGLPLPSHPEQNKGLAAWKYGMNLIWQEITAA